MTGFLHNIWARIEEVGQISVDPETHRAESIVFDTPQMATEFVSVCYRDDIWENPLRAEVEQQEHVVRLIWPE